MVNGYGYHLPDRIIKPAKMVQTPTAGVLFLWVCRDSREAAQGVQPLVAAKPPYRSAGKVSLCGDKPSAERTRPQGCISAPFVPKGFIRRSRPRLVFSDMPALPRPLRQAGASAAASSSVMVLASGTMLSKTAPRTIRRWLRVRRSSRDSFCRNIFSRFSYCRIFFLLSSISAGQFFAGFLSRFRHRWSLLSACRHRKRTVDFSAALLGGY